MALNTDNSSFANDTGGSLEDDSFYIKWTYFLFTMYIVISIVGVFGNGLVIYVILRFARMQTVTNCYILNLAIADEIFVLVMPIFGASLIKDTWEFGAVTCYISTTIDISNQFTSVYTLTAMSVDRYIAVCHPAQAGRYRRFPIVVGICIGIWIISVCSAMPMIIHITHDKSRCFMDFTRFGNDQTWMVAMYLYTLSLGLLIPLAVIMVSYIMLLLRLKQVTARTGKSKKNRKVTNMVMIIVVVFVLCWSPFYIVRAFYVFEPESVGGILKLFKIIFDGTMLLSYINSCANPILYGFLSDNFRKSYQHARPCVKTDQEDISVNDSYIRKKYKSVTTCPRWRSRRGNRDELEDSAQRGNNYRLAPMTMMTSTTCAGSPYSRVPKEDI